MTAHRSIVAPAVVVPDRTGATVIVFWLDEEFNGKHTLREQRYPVVAWAIDEERIATPIVAGTKLDDDIFCVDLGTGAWSVGTSTFDSFERARLYIHARLLAEQPDNQKVPA